MQCISLPVKRNEWKLYLTEPSTLQLIMQPRHEPSTSSYAKQATARASKPPEGLSVKTTHNNKCVINHYLFACQYIPVSLKTLPSGRDTPNREVDVIS